MYAKKNVRTTFRSNRRFHLKRSKTSFSNNKHHLRGNITQLYEKYLKQAKIASSSGDRIQAEYYNQFADHYSRLMIENGIKSSESIQASEELSENLSKENLGENGDDSNQDSVIAKSSSPDNTQSNELENIDSNELEATEESIESVPFIAQPLKKNIRSKKNK